MAGDAFDSKIWEKSLKIHWLLYTYTVKLLLLLLLFFGGDVQRSYCVSAECVFRKSLYIRWRHFTTTTRILFVFPFMVIQASFNLQMKAKLEEKKSSLVFTRNLEEILRDTAREKCSKTLLLYQNESCAFCRARTFSSLLLEKIQVLMHVVII